MTVFRKSPLAILVLVFVLTGTIKAVWPIDAARILANEFEFLSPTAAMTVILTSSAVELAIAIGVCLQRTRVAALMCATGISSIFAAINIVLLLQNSTACGCFGRFWSPGPGVMLGIDMLLLLFAVVGLNSVMPSDSKLPYKTLMASVGVFLMSILLSVVEVQYRKDHLDVQAMPQTPKLLHPTAVAEDKQADPDRVAWLRSLTGNREIAQSVIRELWSGIHDTNSTVWERYHCGRLLVEQNAPVKGLLQTFCDMARDSSESYQWREYCVQFTQDIVPQGPEKEEMVEFLWDMTDRGDGAIPGTAMLIMQRQFEAGALPQQPGFCEAVKEFAFDSARDPLARMGAIGVLSDLPGGIDIPGFVRLLKDETHTGVMRSLISAIGRHGTPVDIAVLEPFKKSGGDLVRICAESAIVAIQSRNSTR